jgi:hypothetical protein
MADPRLDPPAAAPDDPLFLERVMRYLEGELTPDGVSELQRELLGDAAKRQSFTVLCLGDSLGHEELSFETRLARGHHRASNNVAGGADRRLQTQESMILPVIHPDDPPDLSILNSLATGQVFEPPAQPASSGASAWMERKRLRRIAAAVLVIAGSLGTALLWSQFRRGGGSSAATLTRVVDAKWGAQPSAIGARLPAHTRLSLTAGYAELTFDAGAVVVVEAPAEFVLQSPGVMSLLSGKLAATVPPPAHGFTVVTPSASVTDLGTQFGMMVSGDDQTRVEVFVGTVRASGRGDGSDSAPANPGQLLVAGQAAVLSSAAVTVDPAGASPQRYAWSLADDVASLDLVDLFSGGDGTTALHRAGIDPVTGGFATDILPQRYGDDVYHRVYERPVIDGCFVPDGRQGPMAIDSAGDRFLFSAASGFTDYIIWGGGAIPMPPDAPLPSSSRLGKVDYSQPGHDLIFMHANAGVTFDLNVIRTLHPASEIASFQFVSGNSYAAKGLHSEAELFVIVNGETRFRRKLKNTDAPVPVNLPLSAGDRFLTLAVTEDGNGTYGDWIVFADPKLEIAAR